MISKTRCNQMIIDILGGATSYQSIEIYRCDTTVYRHKMSIVILPEDMQEGEVSGMDKALWPLVYELSNSDMLNVYCVDICDKED